MTDAVRTCTVCKESKGASEFYLVPDKKGGKRLAASCIACRRRIQLEYQASLPGGNRGRHMERNYGITIVDFNMKKLKQGGVCFLCGQPETARHRTGGTRDLCIDHDHETGKVRHLLCSRCNFLVGHIEKAGDRLSARAIQYIEHHRNGIYDEED